MILRNLREATDRERDREVCRGDRRGCGEDGTHHEGGQDSNFLIIFVFLISVSNFIIKNFSIIFVLFCFLLSLNITKGKRLTLFNKPPLLYILYRNV